MLLLPVGVTQAHAAYFPTAVQSPLFLVHLLSVSSVVEYLDALSELVQSLNVYHHPVFHF